MPKGLRKIHFSVEARGLTRFGGLALFQGFCKSLGLRRFLQRHIRWPSSGRKYHPVDIFLTHIFAVAAGIGRIENTRSLLYNGLLPQLLGLPEFPHRDTLRSFLVDATPQFLASLRSAHNRLRIWTFQNAFSPWSATLDLDTTALRVFGRKMEGAKVGYVPHYAHQRCYHVRLLSEAKTGMSLAGELRPGNIQGTVDLNPFLKTGLSILPSRIASSRIRIRADAEFYDRNLIEFLDEKGLRYAIVARVTRRIRGPLEKAHYRRVRGGWEAARFLYQPIHWERAHRFIAVRKLKVLLEPPITLFILRDYAYRVLVSELSVRPEHIWRFYNRRANQELLIRELKGHYSMVKIPSRRLIANQVYLEIVLWTYDLIHLFKHLCLPSRCRPWSVSTLRRELWVLPAEFVRSENRGKLRLPIMFPHQNIFSYAQKATEGVPSLE